MQEVAVRGVHLDEVEADRGGAARGGDELRLHRGEPGIVQHARHGAARIGHVAAADRVEAALRLALVVQPLPGPRGRALAP